MANLGRITCMTWAGQEGLNKPLIGICSEPFTRTAHRFDGPGPFARWTGDRRRVFLPANVMEISEHLHTTLRHNIRISNERESSINLILLMQTVILGYLKSFQMAMDDSDYNMGFKTRACCRVLLWTCSASYHVTYKRLLKSFICTSAA